MAYTIGSEAGKKKAQEMKAGEKWTNTKDGSTWTKNSDGSVSVTHQGVTTNNAYKPSSPSGSSGGSGGSYSGGNSGGSSYNKNSINSQYTATGTHNDAGLPSDALNKINIYKNMYNSAMAAGKIEEANAAHDAAEAIRAQYGYSGGVDGSEYIKLTDKDLPWEFEYDEETPEYEKPYDPAIEQLLNEILNREDFSYNAQNDPLYQQYASMYQQEGNRAMQETMANAAASAGGMNSYAITAAQQANNYYGSQLANKIPELYQLAYEMYLQDKESKVQDLGLLQGVDSTLYNRYRDTMSDYYADRNFAYGKYRDDVTQNNWEKEFAYNQFINDRNFNYGVSQDAIDQSWKEKEWNNNMSQQELASNRYDQENAKNEAYALLELGQMPPSDLLKAAGIDEAYASAYLAGVKAQQTKVSSGGSSGGSGGSGYTGKKEGDKPKEKEEPGDTGYTGTESNTPSKDVTQHKDYNNGSVAGLGIGMINNDTLEQLIKIGGVVGDEDGNFYWADGWSANNYQERMKSLNGIGYLFTH